MEFKLTKSEHQLLIFALGLATGAASDNKPLFWRLVALSNAVNKNNPDWIPYEIEATHIT